VVPEEIRFLFLRVLSPVFVFSRTALITATVMLSLQVQSVLNPHLTASHRQEKSVYIRSINTHNDVRVPRRERLSGAWPGKGFFWFFVIDPPRGHPLGGGGTHRT